MSTLYHGVGIDDSGKRNAIYRGKKLAWINPCFQRWKSMLKRCYGPSGVNDSSYLDATVCDEWLYFSAFEKWMLSQRWESMELDKDYLSLSSKVYSPQTCAFVPKEINYFLGSSPSRKGQWPLGVSYSEERGKYSAYVRRNGKSVGLGRFKAPCEAHLAYQKAKLKVGVDLLESLGSAVDSRVAVSMRVIFQKLSDDITAKRETPSLHPIKLPESYKAQIAEQISEDNPCYATT